MPGVVTLYRRQLLPVSEGMGGCLGGWAVSGNGVGVGLDALPDVSSKVLLATCAAATLRFVPAADIDPIKSRSSAVAV